MGCHEPFLGGVYWQIYKLPQAAWLKNNHERLDYCIPKALILSPHRAMTQRFSLMKKR
ncbi:MAG: hypothetical protein Q8930_05225 [Bacillota bacterium]|nr:hypothetical protein [Bacillota bacterium]